MLYFAPRERLVYLEVKPPQSPHYLASIAGGGGFLHFINSHTQKLILIDKNAQQLEYCLMIIDLIKMSQDVFDFLSLVSGKEVNKRDLTFDCLTDIDANHKIANSYYQKLMSNRNKCFYFGKPRLTLETFFWTFGSEFPCSAFHSNKSFLEMKQSLCNIPTNTIQSKLEDLDYAEICSSIPTYLYLSNCDHPFYSKSETILRQIRNSISKHSTIVYRTWRRSLTIRSEQHHIDCVEKLKPLTSDGRVVEARTYAGYNFSDDELKCKKHELVNIEDASAIDWSQSFKKYMRGIFLYHISLENTQQHKSVVQQFLFNLLGVFANIIIVDHERFAGVDWWIANAKAIGMHHSYEIDKITWSGGKDGVSRNIIMSWALLGHEGSR